MPTSASMPWDRNRLVALPGLTAAMYEHPLDKQMLDAVKNTPGLPLLIRKLFEYGIEKLLEVEYTGSNVRVNSSNVPMADQALRDAVRVLAITGVPDLYCRPDYLVNGMTTGVSHPLIVTTSGAVDYLTAGELTCLVGHEVGHIKSEHVLYHMVATVFPVIGEILGSMTLGIGGLVSAGLQLALLNWVRASEFTADRAGLLACQDLDTAIRLLVKLAGLPRRSFDTLDTQDFIAQARQFASLDSDTLSRFFKFASVLGATHPWTVMRASELLKWVDSGEYQRVLNAARTGAAPSAVPPVSVCPACRAPITPGGRFCARCGRSVN